MSRKTMMTWLVVGATLFIGALIAVIIGSNGWRNWDFKTWFNHWGKGHSTVKPVEPDTPTESDTPTNPDFPSELPKCVHVEIKGGGKSPTCTESGLTDGVYCSLCCVTLVEQQIIPALGHTEVDDYGYAATCTDTGLTDGKHCSVCDTVTVEQKPIAALGHTEVDDYGYAATCTDTGLTDGKHCSVCDMVTVEQKPISKIPHSYVRDVCSECGQDNPNPVLDKNGFYLVGSMNGWNWTSDKYKFDSVATDIEGVTSQYKLTITLTAGTEFKVWRGNDSYYDNFESVEYVQWTENGGFWNPTCTETATYNFYLKFYSNGGCSIYVEKL